MTALDVLSALIDVWIASYGIPDSTLSDSGPQFASVLYQGVLELLGVRTNYATPSRPQTNGQVECFNKTLVRQLGHYVSENVVTWTRYVTLLVTAYNAQVHSSTGEAPFPFVCPRKLSPVALERLTQGTGEEETPSTPKQARENFRTRLDDMIPLVQKSMDKAQARYKRHFDERVLGGREALRVGDWVFVKSHENKGGKRIIKTKGPYQILKKGGRHLTIESTDGIRKINGNPAILAPEPRGGDRAWNCALKAWRIRSFPSSSGKTMEAVFDQFVGQGYDDHGSLMRKVCWFGYGPREDTWECIEDLPTEKVRHYCLRHKVAMRQGRGVHDLPATPQWASADGQGPDMSGTQVGRKVS